jgi:hypothetical protein
MAREFARTRISLTLAATLLLAAAFPARAQSTRSAPQPMGYENDVYCFGFVGSPQQPFVGSVVSGDAVYEQSAFSTDDILYVDSAGDIRAGDEYWFVAPMDDVVEPGSNAYVGRFFQYLGYGKAICVKEGTAIVQVEFSCTGVSLGAELLPFEPIPVPLSRRTAPVTSCDDPSGKATGRIVYSRDGVESMGTGSDAIIDLGADANLAPGDFLTVYRYARPREFDITESGALLAKREAIVVPRTMLGEAAVLTVGDHTATVRIVSSSHAIQVGDDVQIK